jgi:hypothetical protein
LQQEDSHRLFVRARKRPLVPPTRGKERPRARAQRGVGMLATKIAKKGMWAVRVCLCKAIIKHSTRHRCRRLCVEAVGGMRGVEKGERVEGWGGGGRDWDRQGDMVAGRMMMMEHSSTRSLRSLAWLSHWEKNAARTVLFDAGTERGENAQKGVGVGGCVPRACSKPHARVCTRTGTVL